MSSIQEMRAKLEAQEASASSESSSDESTKSKSSSGSRRGFSVSTPKCESCAKSVYPVDSLQADGKVFHKACFRCATCNNVIKLGNYASLEGKYYCKPHFKQLFKLKGNYAEGFGGKKPDQVWREGKGLSSEGPDSDTSSSSDSSPGLGEEKEPKSVKEILQERRAQKAAAESNSPTAANGEEGPAAGRGRGGSLRISDLQRKLAGGGDEAQQPQQQPMGGSVILPGRGAERGRAIPGTSPGRVNALGRGLNLNAVLAAGGPMAKRPPRVLGESGGSDGSTSAPSTSADADEAARPSLGGLQEGQKIEGGSKILAHPTLHRARSSRSRRPSQFPVPWQPQDPQNIDESFRSSTDEEQKEPATASTARPVEDTAAAEAARKKREAEAAAEAERKRKEAADADRKRREAEEAAAAQRKKQEAEAAEAERKKKAAAEAERKKKQEADAAAAAKKKQEAEAAEAERKRKAAEEAEKKRAADEAARKKREADEAERKRKAAEEAEKKRAADEAARKKRESDEAERKRKAAEEAEKKRAADEAARKKREAEIEAARKRGAEEAERKRAAEAEQKKREDADRERLIALRKRKEAEEAEAERRQKEARDKAEREKQRQQQEAEAVRNRKNGASTSGSNTTTEVENPALREDGEPVAPPAESGSMFNLGACCKQMCVLY